MKYMVWGLGRSTRTLLTSGYLDRSQIVGFIDSDERTFAHSGGGGNVYAAGGAGAS